MKLNHLFISVLDVNEQLPFVIKEAKNLQQNFELQEKAKEELNRFIVLLEKQFKEDIFYIGTDVICEKSF